MINAGIRRHASCGRKTLIKMDESAGKSDLRSEREQHRWRSSEWEKKKEKRSGNVGFVAHMIKDAVKIFKPAVIWVTIVTVRGRSLE